MLCTFDTWYTVNGLLKMDFQVELKNNAFNPPRHGILGENRFFLGNFVVWPLAANRAKSIRS